MTAMSSSNVFCEMVQKPDFRPMERVNPFDKNSIPKTKSSTDSDDSFDIIDSNKKSSFVSDTPKDYYSKLSDVKGTTCEVSIPPSNNFKRDVRSHSMVANDDSTKYGYKDTTSSETFTSKKKYEDPKSQGSLDSYKSVNNKFTRSSGSLSDADIIFGDLKNKSNNVNDYSSYRSSTESDSVFGKSDASKTSFDKNAPTYKIYDGIQNHAFTDFDSPKSSGLNLSNTDDEDYDLK